MDITPERHGTAVVFNLDGPLTVETNTCRLHAMARSLARIDARNLVLDLRHVCRMDSYGVGQLVEVYNEVRSGGLTLELTNVEQHQKRLFELAGLLALIPVFEPRQETAAHPGDPTARRSGAERTDCQLDAA